jgi:hypothetical protein
MRKKSPGPGFTRSYDETPHAQAEAASNHVASMRHPLNGTRCALPFPGRGRNGQRTADRSALGALRHLQRIVHLDAEVAHRTLQLAVREQQLRCAKIVRAPVDQRRLGPAERVRAVGGGVGTDEPERLTMPAYCRAERCAAIRSRLGKK